MSQVANNRKRARWLLWFGIAAAAIVAIAVFRIQLSTLLYVGAFLALPFLMMRMHGGGHGRGSGCGGDHGGSSEQTDETREQDKVPRRVTSSEPGDLTLAPEQVGEGDPRASAKPGVLHG